MLILVPKKTVLSKSYFTTHTGTLDRISFQPLFIHTQGCHGCQTKQTCKGFTKSLVWCAVFHSKLRKVQKTSKQHKNWLFFKTFFDFSPFWLKNSAPNQKFWNPLPILFLLTPKTSLGMDEQWRYHWFLETFLNF